MSEQEETVRGYREIGHEIVDDMMDEIERLRTALKVIARWPELNASADKQELLYELCANMAAWAENALDPKVQIDAEEPMTEQAEDYKATPAVWRKRLLQVPALAFNFRQWTVGASWDAPEDEGFFCLHFGPVGLIWDMWP